MAKTVIQFNKLGKSYMIGHKNREQRYIALRDVIGGSMKKLWSRIRNPEYYTHENLEEFWALKNIDLEVQEGDRLGIIGPNGAGKTTLLKILSRITTPTTGQVNIKGRIASLLEVGTGFHPELTGRENIYLNGAILGMNRSEIKHKFDEIVDFAGVEQFLDTPVKRFSSGMNVRLGFAVAAHLDPDILIVDEVLAVGDAEFREKAIGKMREVSESAGRTVLFVSHNMKVIKELCKRTILLEEGKVKNDGATNEVISKYTTVENYGGLQSEVSFAENENILYQIRAVRIIDHGGKISAKMDRSKPFRVEIDYDIRENTKNVNIEFSIELLDGTLIYHGADTDLAPDQIINREQGSYRTSVEFPSYLLNAADYKIVAFTRYRGIDYDFPEKQPIFHLEDNGTYASGPNVYVVDQQGQRRGILAMPLKWESGC